MSARLGMDSDAPESRRLAVRAVGGQTFDEDARATLLRGLDDEDWRVRREAAEVLSAFAPSADDPIVPRLIDGLLQSSRVGFRNACLEALGRLGPGVAAPLGARLADTEGGDRKFLIGAIGASGDTASVDALARFVSDSDPNVGAAALDAISALGGPAAEALLRARLSTLDPLQQVSVLDGLMRMGAHVPFAELEPILSSRLGRRAALPLVGRSADPAAFAPVIGALDGSNHEARLAVRALAALLEDPGPPDAFRDQLGTSGRARVRGLLKDDGPETASAAATVALMARDTEALADVLSASAGRVLSAAAVRALRTWGPSAAPPLLRAADEVVGGARALALELAAELVVPESDAANAVRDRLRVARTEAEPGVVGAALRGLSALAQAEDAPQLVECAMHDAEAAGDAVRTLEALSERAGQAVLDALGSVRLELASAPLARLVARLRGQDALGQLQAGLSSASPEVRRSCLAALGQLADPSSVDRIAFAMADEDEGVRIAAIDSLGRVGSERAADALLHALGADSLAVRSRAIRALARMGESRALPHLVPFVTGPAIVAMEAIEALARLRAPDLAEQVRAALGHEDPDVVQRALTVAQGLDDSDQVDHLVRGLQHPSWHVRSTAARILGALDLREAHAALEAHASDEQDPHVQEALRAAVRAKREAVEPSPTPAEPSEEPTGG